MGKDFMHIGIPVRAGDTLLAVETGQDEKEVFIHVIDNGRGIEQEHG